MYCKVYKSLLLDNLLQLSLYMFLLFCSYLLLHFWFYDFVHMYIYLFIFLSVFFFSFLFVCFSFFLFLFLFLIDFFILGICFLVVISYYLDLPKNFFCHGINIFYLDLGTSIRIFRFIFLDLYTSICLVNKFMLYNV